MLYLLAKKIKRAAEKVVADPDYHNIMILPRDGFILIEDPTIYGYIDIRKDGVIVRSFGKISRFGRHDPVKEIVDAWFD